jgi:hypothetical protein
MLRQLHYSVEKVYFYYGENEAYYKKLKNDKKHLGFQ